MWVSRRFSWGVSMGVSKGWVRMFRVRELNVRRRWMMRIRRVWVWRMRLPMPRFCGMGCRVGDGRAIRWKGRSVKS